MGERRSHSVTERTSTVRPFTTATMPGRMLNKFSLDAEIKAFMDWMDPTESEQKARSAVLKLSLIHI